MVANLAKETPEKPALMSHTDVVTFFHEMGHIFHELLSHTKFSRFHGTTVALDFGEAPSQMLENWCFEPKVLELMSSHYESGKPLDAELIDKIIKRWVVRSFACVMWWMARRRGCEFECSCVSAAADTSMLGCSTSASCSSPTSTSRCTRTKVSLPSHAP